MRAVQWVVLLSYTPLPLRGVPEYQCSVKGTPSTRRLTRSLPLERRYDLFLQNASCLPKGRSVTPFNSISTVHSDVEWLSFQNECLALAYNSFGLFLEVNFSNGTNRLAEKGLKGTNPISVMFYLFEEQTLRRPAFKC